MLARIQIGSNDDCVSGTRLDCVEDYYTNESVCMMEQVVSTTSCLVFAATKDTQYGFQVWYSAVALLSCCL